MNTKVEIHPHDAEFATKGDMRLLKGDVCLLKEDMCLLKSDIQLIKSDIQLLSGEMIALEKRMADNTRQIIGAAFEEFAIIIKRSFDDINERMVTKDEFQEFRDFKAAMEPAVYGLQTDMVHVKHRLDRVENEVTDLKQEFISSRIAVTDMLRDHEKRIIWLEGDVPEARRRRKP